MNRELALVEISGHQVMIVQDINDYEIFVSHNGSIGTQPIMSVTGLQNALASVRVMVENDKRLSADTQFLIRQKD